MAGGWTPGGLGTCGGFGCLCGGGFGRGVPGGQGGGLAAAGGLILGGCLWGGLEGTGNGQYGHARERFKIPKLRRRIRVWMMMLLLRLPIIYQEYML